MGTLVVLRPAVLLAMTAGLAAGQAKEVHKTVPINAGDRVIIDTYKGSIRVSTWDRNEVQVDARIEEDFGWFGASAALGDVSVENRAGAVEIKSEFERLKTFFGLGSQPFFHYTIQMPRTARLQIKDYKSETDIRGVAADVEVKTYKGSLRVSDVTGTLTVDTYKGDVDIYNLAGGLLLDTYKGDVRADLRTFDRRSRVETHKGRVDLTLPRGAAFELRADLERKTDFASDFAVAGGRRANEAVSGPVNGGGPELTLKSYKGDLRLLER
jgi:hypothetical protein